MTVQQNNPNDENGAVGDVADDAKASSGRPEATETDPTEGIATESSATEESATEESATEESEGEQASPAATEATTEVDDSELAAAEAAFDDTPVTRPSPGPVELVTPEAEDVSMDWYILKVQSNRERTIAEALRRKIKKENLDSFFGEVIVPTEKVTEFKAGKKKVVERKLWPGYIVVHMHINDDTWFAVRETGGIGDFTGSAGKPTPMEKSEVDRILQSEVEESVEAPRLNIKFSEGDKVKVQEGNFENFEGEVSAIDEASGRVTVMINIFGRSTPVELEYWQIESL